MAGAKQMVAWLMGGIHELIDPLRQAINLVCPRLGTSPTGGQEFIDGAVEIEFHKLEFLDV
jgi:hypothetical protein